MVSGSATHPGGVGVLNEKISLRQIRESLMLSKSELAKKAGVSPLTISRVELGKPCRIDTQRKIPLALGLKPSDKDSLFRDKT